MDHQLFTLPNGIRLIHKPSDSAVTHACIVINAGSRDEPVGKDGLAHFIEHLLFKQTEKRGTRQILNYIEAVGGDLNAYTTKEYTCVHASILTPFLDRAFDLFEDIIFHSIFPQSEIDKEKGVVLDEIASYQDQPEEAIMDDFEDCIFEGHALGRNILGTADSVDKLTRPDIVDFLKTSYSTEEIVIGISGDYNFKRLCHMFTKFFGAIPHAAGTKNRTLAPYSIVNSVQDKSISQVHCIIGNQAYSIHDKRKNGFTLLNNMLGGFGMASLLNLNIREKYGIAYTIESSYVPFSDTGVFSIYFGTDVEKKDKALSLIHKQLKTLRDKGVSPVALEKAKKKFNGMVALGEDNRLSLIIAMSKSILDYGRVDTLEEVFARINAVTVNEISEIANEVLDPTSLSLLMFQPDGSEE